MITQRKLSLDSHIKTARIMDKIKKNLHTEYVNL